jgi:hypothetical protein
MHVHAPTLSIPRRAQVLSAVAAVAIAGGVIAVAANDNEATQSSQTPAVTKVDTSRVLDGSPILRGTANRVDTSRVLDGSPILRGINPAPPPALQPPKGHPEAFHR